MPYAFTMRPETTFDLTTYWVVVDGDNVGTIAPFKGGQLAPVSVPLDYWSWRIKFLLLDMPDWCKGRAPTLEQAQVEAEQAFTQIRDSLSQTEYDQAMWKKDGKVRGLN
jgi:hypothetical protein